MNVVMAGIDYSLATIEVRERFALTKTGLEAVYKNIITKDFVLGAVVLSTCNRTEIYLSFKEDVVVDPFQVLCEGIGIEFANYSHLYRGKKGSEVIKHLCEVACGIKSQIWGEDQIIAQVKNAITLAREAKAADGVLEVLFRNAIAAAKKVKATINLSNREGSVVDKALEVLQAKAEIKRVLVIGNGEIGRLMTKALIAKGYQAIMTLRQYRHGANVVPEGATVVDYSGRYDCLATCDGVISATLSPHHTIDLAGLQALSTYPKLFIDLAVPRDIDPAIVGALGVSLYDVDGLCGDAVNAKQALQLAEIEKITAKYIENYENWCLFKKGLVCV